MNSPWDFYYSPFYTGADDVVVPVVVDPTAAVVDDAAAATAEASAAQQAALAQQQALADQQAALAAQQAAVVERPVVVPQVLPILPTVSRHHVWRRRNGTQFRTRIGTPQDYHAMREQQHGRVFRVAGETYVGAPAELYFTVVKPGGATMRWQDSSVQDAQQAIPMGTTFQGVLRPHDLIEVTSPGYVGWVSVYDVNQLGATKTGYAGDLQFRVVNPHGAGMRWRDSSPMEQSHPIPFGTIVLGTPRGDGYIVEISSGGINGWVSALDLEQLTSAPPSPALVAPQHATHGDFTGADDGSQWGPLDPTCPPGMAWQPGTLQCVPMPHGIPAPPHATHGYYAGADVVPVLPCPPGQFWGEQANHCVPNIPLPPPMTLPPTLADWHAQHATTGEVAGWGAWGWPHAHHHPGYGHFEEMPPWFVGAEGGGAVAHPAVPVQNHPAEHANAHANEAIAHAQMAARQASPNAHAAIDHARQSREHAHQAHEHAHDPRRAHMHAEQAMAHAHLARHFGEFERGRPGFERGRPGFERRGFGFRGERGFARGRIGRFVHAHPEWHRRGHPAWAHGVHPQFARHHAECVRDSGGGLIKAIFGGRRHKHCFIERIHHPGGFVTYRTTPAGVQENVQLDPEMVTANSTFTQQTQQQAPTADDGPMPGSDDKSNGADEPEKPKDDHADASADAGAGDAGGGDATADAGGGDAGGGDAGGGDASGTASEGTSDAGAADQHAAGYFTGAEHEYPFEGHPMYQHPHHPHAHHPGFDPYYAQQQEMASPFVHPHHQHHHHPMEPYVAPYEIEQQFAPQFSPHHPMWGGGSWGSGWHHHGGHFR